MFQKYFKFHFMFKSQFVMVLKLLKSDEALGKRKRVKFTPTLKLFFLDIWTSPLEVRIFDEHLNKQEENPPKLAEVLKYNFLH